MATAAACAFVFAAAIVSYAVDSHLAQISSLPAAAPPPTSAPAPELAETLNLRGTIAPDDNPLRNRESRRLKTMLATAE